MVSSTATARDSTGMPLSGRPDARAASTSVAITAARNTLGSGVTRTTKPNNTVTDATTRQPRGTPATAPPSMMRPMITAQFAPDTAVKWLSDDAFIAASSSSLTAEVSPMASPGNRAPPSPGSATEAARKLLRSSFAQARYHGGSLTICGSTSGNSRNAVESSGGVARTVPESCTSVPIPAP